MGLDFGIWVEPEMVNVDSNLYREHPEWAMDIPGKPHAEGRNQRLLDLTRTDVQDYIITQMSTLFSSANIAYVKWDMNRTVTDYYAKELPRERQGEVAHRYVLGLYRCMRELTERFPNILFEGCSAGGNRFDLGILCYFPQIWASDDTDALCRAEIQTGYSYGYPLSAISAHVSACPNHQTLRTTPLETRFHVAAFGVCGYECNFNDMKKEEIEAVKVQIALYKKWRSVLQFGNFYRGRSVSDGLYGIESAIIRSPGNATEWTCVSEDRTRAVGFLMQKLVVPNTPFEDYHAKGLDEGMLYHFYNRELKYNVKEFGDLINTVAPIHVKQDSLTHNLIEKFVKMDGETEDCAAYGDTLMYNGIKLRQAFAATGYSDEVRYFQDFGSRMYFMENLKEV
jgi:alpha-galactosidase